MNSQARFRHLTPLRLPTWLAMLAYFFVFDQMLLPMFHLGHIPFKVSYFIMGFVALAYLSSAGSKHRLVAVLQRNFLRFCLPIIVIVACSLLGELFFVLSYNVTQFSELCFSLLSYVLIVLAFAFGQCVYRLDLKVLLFFIYAYILITLLFTFASSHFSFLGRLYYSQDTLDAILGYTRPRGLFGNPNVSMLMLNSMLLFLVVGYKRGYVRFNNAFHLPVILIGGLAVSMVLASKNQFIVFVLIMFYHFATLMKHKPASQKFMIFLLIIGLLCGVFGVLMLYDNGKAVDELMLRFSQVQLNPNDITHKGQSILRPLFALPYFWARFSHSPLFGFGFDPVPHGLLNYSTHYMHNDVFKILATSGVIGFCAYLYLIYRYSYKLSPLLVLPFVFPGLTNTFIQVVPAILLYYFMIAIFWEKQNNAISRG